MCEKRNQQFDLLVSGRAGIDLNATKTGCPFTDIPSFSKSVGGSPSNIIIGAAKLGLKTAFIGKVSRDGMGEYIRNVFEGLGIDTRGLIYDKTGARNCLAILEVISAERSGVYAAVDEGIFHGTYLYREGTADMLLERSEIDEELVAASRAVLVTGTAFSLEPSRGAMFQILEYAKKHGAMVALDLDYRPSGWTSREETAECYQSILPYCDIVIGNREEFDVIEYLSMPDNTSNQRSAERLLEQGVGTVIVKDGKNGSWGYRPNETPICRGVIPTKALKTFGSGDAYAAGLMYGILNGYSLGESIEMGTANASLALSSGISCSDSMPFREAMLEHWKKNRTCWGE